MKRPLAWALAAGVAAFAGATPAWAQLGPTGSPAGMSPLINPQASDRQKAPVKQPDALPGASSNSERVTPQAADHPVAQMEPTDALFDAINRGDMGSARDAINRGADLSARNVLGMTPMELSVDLNRNDITFLLLSMRGSDSNPVTATAQKGKSPFGKATKEAQVQRHPAAPAKSAARVAPPPAPQYPKLFAGNGGTPNPNAGFLGFDSGRSEAQ